MLAERVARLRTDFPSMLHDVLDREELPSIAKNKKLQGNLKKKVELARRTIGGMGIARAVKNEFHHKIRQDVLAVIGKDFPHSFESTLRYSTNMLNEVRGPSICLLVLPRRYY